jgi:cytochrome c peroxidase
MLSVTIRAVISPIPAFFLILLASLPSIAAAASEGTLGLPPRSEGGEPLQSAARAALGKRLFFDTRLSADGTISCASCHKPERAFADGLPVARGIHGQLGTRNTPSLLNAAYGTSEFWEGRRDSLEHQAIDPLLNPREHGLRNANQLLGIIQGDPEYARMFAQTSSVREPAITLDRIVSALASFERTLLAGGSPADQYLFGGQREALSAAAVRGLDLFRGRAGCSCCHTIGEQSALFTDNLYHRVGVGMQPIAGRLAAATTRVIGASPAELDQLNSEDPDIAALGRFVVTKNPKDIGLFKTPSLRNVALTAPYMHDGSVKTLPEAIDVEVYYRTLEANRPLILTPLERADLIAFLESLSSPTAVAHTPF